MRIFVSWKPLSLWPAYSRIRTVFKKYWPNETGPLFATPAEYVPRLLRIIQDSPHPRVRSLAAFAVPASDQATIDQYESVDRIGAMSELILLAKLGDSTRFRMLLTRQVAQRPAAARYHEIGNPRGIAVTYCLGPHGAFIEHADGGKGERYQFIDETQLFALLSAPLDYWGQSDALEKLSAMTGFSLHRLSGNRNDFWWPEP